MTSSAHASYDEVPYEGGVVVGSHPEHLATLGQLFGMTPAPVEGCRVLEIGCASGTNLLPMAYSLPDSQFVGIDLSERQVQMGRELLAGYGVTNVELIAADIRELPRWDRKFDYIVCHGVLTWVAPDVQEAIMGACSELLAPQGIAFISYNALPGFHLRAGIGEMLRFHARHFGGSRERVEQSRALLDFIVDSTSRFDPGDALLRIYHDAIQYERNLLSSVPGSYLMHEHLEDNASALYLHEFVEFADSHSLQYLGDSAFNTMLVRDLPDDVAESIHSIAPNQLFLEQYRDFVVNRMFRKSLICRSDVVLERHISVEAIRSLTVRHRLSRAAGEPWRIDKVGGLSVEVRDPQVTQVLDIIDKSAPAALSFEGLATAMAPDPPTAEHLAAILLSLYSLDAVEFRTWTPEVAGSISARPEAFLPARKAAAAGMRSIPTPYHNTIELDRFICLLLPMLDGRVEPPDLVSSMHGMSQSGSLAFEGRPPGEVLGRDVIERLVGEALEQLRKAGLLVN